MFVRTGVPPTGVLRLRQKKGSVGGSVLKDEHVLTKALPRLADDTPIVLQLLDEPHAEAPADGLLIQVRRWRSEGEAEVLEDPREMCVPRDADGHKLLAMLVSFLCPSATAATAPQDQGGRAYDAAGAAVVQQVVAGTGDEAGSGEGGVRGGGLACAKVSSFGPVLKGISKAKLKWLDESSADATAPVTSPPLGLRDDSVIVVRDQLEFERFAAAAAAHMGKEQEALMLQKQPRQKRMTRETGPHRREAALQIHVHSDARFDPREQEQALAASIQANGGDNEQPRPAGHSGGGVGGGGGNIGKDGDGGTCDHVSSGNDGGREEAQGNVLREGDYV